jgi:hypothetical protein
LGKGAYDAGKGLVVGTAGLAVKGTELHLKMMSGNPNKMLEAVSDAYSMGEAAVGHLTESARLLGHGVANPGDVLDAMTEIGIEGSSHAVGGATFETGLLVTPFAKGAPVAAIAKEARHGVNLLAPKAVATAETAAGKAAAIRAAARALDTEGAETIAAQAARSVGPHRMTAQLVRDGGVVQEGEFLSGGMRGVNSWQGQLLVHTERKAIRTAEALAEEGDLLRMSGQLDPCRVGCQPAVRSFVEVTGARAEYSASETGRVFRWAPQRFGELKGTVLQELFEQGELVGRWRYWRTEAGRSRRAALPIEEATRATGTTGR